MSPREAVGGMQDTCRGQGVATGLSMQADTCMATGPLLGAPEVVLHLAGSLSTSLSCLVASGSDNGRAGCRSSIRPRGGRTRSCRRPANGRGLLGLFKLGQGRILTPSEPSQGGSSSAKTPLLSLLFLFFLSLLSLLSLSLRCWKRRKSGRSVQATGNPCKEMYSIP